MNFLRTRNWSPYMSGLIIGLLQIPAVFLVDYTLGVSTAFVTIVKELYLFFVDHDAPHTLGATNIWQVGLALGIALGAWVSAKLSGNKRPNISPVWKREVGIYSIKVRYVLSFLGGILLILGARLANGCTSGNGISGTSQLSVSSWVVLISMFVSAVIAAHLVRWVAAVIRKG